MNRDRSRFGTLVLLVLVGIVVIGSCGHVVATGDVATVSDSVDEREVTVVEASMTGWLVSNITAEPSASSMAASINGVDRSEVSVFEDGTIEIRGDPNRTEIEDALVATDVDPTDARIERGVTESTVETMSMVVTTRLEAVIGNSTVESTRTHDGAALTIVTPTTDYETVTEIITVTGVTEIVAQYPDDSAPDGNGRNTLVTADGVESVTQESGSNATDPSISVVLASDTAPPFQNELLDLGYTSREAINTCTIENGDPSGYCLLVTVDDEIITATSVDPNLAEDLASLTFDFDPELTFTIEDEQLRDQVHASLESGPTVGPVTVTSAEVVAVDDLPDELSAPGETESSAEDSDDTLAGQWVIWTVGILLCAVSALVSRSTKTGAHD